MKMRSGNPLVLAFILLLALTLQGCVASSQCASGGCQGDAPNSVYVQTRDGVVYLTGQVATDLQRTTAETVVAKVPGVVRVVNSIALTFGGR
jgi:BON domain-containing protein